MGILDSEAESRLPVGHYTLVSIDIDTTGRRLIDEIVQLAAFSPKAQYAQYIMPYMNLNPAARQRHQVRVISIGFYRMLKSMQTYKIIKAKTEIMALKDFLNWLEDIKAKDTGSLGVTLLYHEERKFIPYMVLQAFEKYNLLDRFLNTVVAFANNNILAQNKLNQQLPTPRQPLTLRRIARVINDKIAEKLTDNNNNNVAKSELSEAPSAPFGGIARNSEEFDGNASVRARLVYEVAHYLCNWETGDNLDASSGYEKLLAAICEQAKPIQADLQELTTQRENVDRQNSFRPVFFAYFKATLYHRVRAVKFRIVLAEKGFDLNVFQEIWNNTGHAGLLESLQAVEALKPEDRQELADLFDSYFDPKKNVIVPVVKNNRRLNRRSSVTPRNGSINNEGNNSARQSEPGAGGDKGNVSGGNGAEHLPDSTAKSPRSNNGFNKSGRPRSKPRNARVRNGSRPQRSTQTQQQHSVTTQTAVAKIGLAVAMPQRVAVAH